MVVKIGLFHKFKREALKLANAKAAIAAITVSNRLSYYAATIGLGTPAQPVNVLVDTGSSRLWVYGTEGRKSNVYNPDESSSYQYVDDSFYIGYVTSSVHGDDASDNINIGDYSVDSFQFGVVNSTTGSVGVMGVGFPGSNGDASKQNIVGALYNSGNIKQRAVSLYLDSLESSQGSMIFGGIDTAKYTGNLWTIPLTDSGAFEIELSSMLIGRILFTLRNKPRVRIDSGSSFAYLPANIIEGIAQQVNAQYDPSSGLYFIDSSDIDKTKSITFNFSGAMITVSTDELFPQSNNFIAHAPKDRFLAIFDSAVTGGMNILGDVFLRSAYAVFDYGNHQLALAQAKFNAEQSNIIELTSSTIPGSKPAPYS
ncbi:hypothetical protein TRVA0_036S01156 [Trichomonascus vanleenenianus]|uniref:pepsin-like aspartic protease n=1 Tax=Trichomonascus vanleenenianus TaxID=2268995 RepID=UPI003ECAA9F3